ADEVLCTGIADEVVGTSKLADAHVVVDADARLDPDEPLAVASASNLVLQGTGAYTHPHRFALGFWSRHWDHERVFRRVFFATHFVGLQRLHVLRYAKLDHDTRDEAADTPAGERIGEVREAVVVRPLRLDTVVDASASLVDHEHVPVVLLHVRAEDVEELSHRLGVLAVGRLHGLAAEDVLAVHHGFHAGDGIVDEEANAFFQKRHGLLYRLVGGVGLEQPAQVHVHADPLQVRRRARALEVEDAEGLPGEFLV